MKIQDNNVVREATAEEIAKNTKDTERYNLIKQAIIDEENAKKVLKDSAKAKLIAGEALTEDEANTIVI